MEMEPMMTWTLMSIENQVRSAALMRGASLKAKAQGKWVPLHELAHAFESIRFEENKRFIANLVERDPMAFDDEQAFWL